MRCLDAGLHEAAAVGPRGALAAPSHAGLARTSNLGAASVVVGKSIGAATALTTVDTLTRRTTRGARPDRDRRAAWGRDASFAPEAARTPRVAIAAAITFPGLGLANWAAQ